MDGGLTGRWVPAAEWQRLWTSEGLEDVDNIAPDLATYDVHPPLYFGLLHGWLILFEDDLRAGRALNLVFAILTMLGIYGLARAVGFRRIEGALAALVWSVSPAVVGISSITRQYDLVALTAVLLVWGLVRVTAADDFRSEAKKPHAAWRWFDVVWLAAATAAALLTHYQAALLVAGAAVYSIVAHRRAARAGRQRSWWPPFAGLGAGVVVAGLAADWTRAVGTERAMLVPPSLAGLVEKLAGIGDTAGQAAGVPGTVAAVALLAVAAAFAIPRSRRTLIARLREARPGWRTIALLPGRDRGGHPAAEPAVPQHAAAAQSQVPGDGLAVRRVPAARGVRAVAARPLHAHGGPAAGCWPWSASLLPPVGAGDPLQIGKLADADAVIIDSVGVGRLPRFLWSVPADTPVFVAGTDEALPPTLSTDDLRAGGRLYFVDLLESSGAATGAHTDAILSALESTADVRLVDESDAARIYLITPEKAD